MRDPLRLGLVGCGEVEAVVDPCLRARGLNGLRVVDSSIMPRIVSGSTPASAGMIGEMGAAMILAPRAAAERPRHVSDQYGHQSA
jgi:choline dehydrogenase-like flavoprotein